MDARLAMQQQADSLSRQLEQLKQQLASVELGHTGLKHGRDGLQHGHTGNNGRDASSLILEHPLLSLQLSSIHEPSSMHEPPSMQMHLDELGPPIGQYMPITGPYMLEDPGHTDTEASNTNSQRSINTDKHWHDSNTNAYPDVSMPLPFQDHNKDTELEVYQDVLSKVQSILQDNSEAQPNSCPIQLEQTNASQDNGITQLLSQIDQAIGKTQSDILDTPKKRSSNAQSSLADASGAQIPAKDQYIKLSSTPIASPSMFCIPKIEYESFIDEDSIYERASDPIMHRYLAPHLLKSNTREPRLPVQQSPRQPWKQSGHDDAHSSVFQDQLSLASLEYLSRHSLCPSEPSTRILDVDHIRRLPKLM